MFMAAAVPAMISMLSMILMRWARKETVPGVVEKTKVLAH
jgi:hypothetical protein